MTETLGTILVTGSSGFVGLALVEHLLSQGKNIVGVDRSLPPETAVLRYQELPGQFAFAQCDVTCLEELKKVFSFYAPEQVVLLAAITASVARESAQAERILQVNTAAVATTLKLSASFGVQRVLLASSGSVYGESGRGDALLCTSSTPLLPESLYGISKLSAELVARRIAALHGLDLRIGRLGTCFGPWEHDTGLRDTLSAPWQVMDLIRRNQTVRLPRPLQRDWLYVRDAAAALTALLHAPSLSDSVYNLGAGIVWSIADWCRWLMEQKDYRHIDWCITESPDTANVDPYAAYDRASMDITPLLRDTNYRPVFGLEQSGVDFLRWLQTSKLKEVTNEHD